jgi:hypothetical protein
MLARRWRLRRSASQRGMLLLCGGFKGFKGPYICQLVYLGLYCLSVKGGVLEGHVHREARVPQVFGAA